MGLLPLVVRLAEQLPAAEEQGLKRHLFDLQVDLPAAVGLDLVQSGERRREPLMRLQAALAVVEMIYPAIDAGELPEAAQALEARLLGRDFAEAEPAPAAEAPEPEDSQGELVATSVPLAQETAGDV